MRTTSFDIIIVGAGMVGLTLANALAQQTALRIAIVEANPHIDNFSPSYYHHRVSAIALSSVRIFKALNSWDAIKRYRVSPFKRIAVWDDDGQGQLQFSSEEIGESVLGYIIENNVLQSSLKEKLIAEPNVQWISPIRLDAFAEESNGVSLFSETGEKITARLAVAADGARSWLRESAGIAITKHAYNQEALVATVETSLAHDACARQVFQRSGPLAFLPLADSHLSSIVWSQPTEQIKVLLALDDQAFKQALQQAFGSRLGIVTHVSKRYSFPLYKQQTKNYVRGRVVLVGDAAHTVHPLAGAGVNMGLLDAASLAEIIIEAEKKQRDFASHATLRRYERWRKADNFALLAGIDVIKYCFESHQPLMATLRKTGLNIMPYITSLKNMFTRYAVGNRRRLPQLAR